MAKQEPLWKTYGRANYAEYVSVLRSSISAGDKRSAREIATIVKTSLGMIVSDRSVRDHRAALREGRSIDAPPIDAQGERFEVQGDAENGFHIESLSARIFTVAQAIEAAGLDLATYEVSKVKIKRYEMGSKGPDNKPVVTPLCSIGVDAKPKCGWSVKEFRELLISDIESLAPDYKRLEHLATTTCRARQGKPEPLLAELSIFDAHFGKLAWGPESGANYDLRICERRYMTAGRDLLGRAAARRPERILFVVGQDFFHTDQGLAAATTKGTPQDCDGRWQKAFRQGTQCVISLAEEGSIIAPVDILVVPGNHDLEKAFCLGEVLAARFHRTERISVINEPSTFAYYRYGKCLLGFVHGDTITSDKKRQELPGTMATDRPADWAETICREWHLGHIHHEHETVWRYRSAEAIRDVTVRYLPSLSSTDAWHRRNNYKSILAAELHLYHKERGRWAYEVHQAQDE